MLVERKLDTRAETYVRDVLRTGKSFSMLLLRRLSDANGTFTTLVSEHVDDDKLYRFREGGVLNERGASVPIEAHGTNYTMQPIPTTDAWVAGLVSSFLVGEPDGACLLENPLASPNSPYLDSIPGQTLRLEQDVYHLIRPGTTEDDVATIIRRVSSIAPPHVGALTAVAADLGTSDEGITITQLQSMADQTATAFIGAYDGEGYVVWTAARNN